MSDDTINDTNEQIPDDLRASMERLVKYATTSIPTEKSKQQLGLACQIDNCQYDGGAEIWVAIRGSLITLDDDPNQHFNVWVCHQHYEQFTHVDVEVLP